MRELTPPLRTHCIQRRWRPRLTRDIDNAIAQQYPDELQDSHTVAFDRSQVERCGRNGGKETRKETKQKFFPPKEKEVDCEVAASALLSRLLKALASSAPVPPLMCDRS